MLPMRSACIHSLGVVGRVQNQRKSRDREGRSRVRESLGGAYCKPANGTPHHATPRASIAPGWHWCMQGSNWAPDQSAPIVHIESLSIFPLIPGWPRGRLGPCCPGHNLMPACKSTVQPMVPLPTSLLGFKGHARKLVPSLHHAPLLAAFLAMLQSHTD